MARGMRLARYSAAVMGILLLAGIAGFASPVADAADQYEGPHLALSAPDVCADPGSVTCEELATAPGNPTIVIWQVLNDGTVSLAVVLSSDPPTADCDPDLGVLAPGQSVTRACSYLVPETAACDLRVVGVATGTTDGGTQVSATITRTKDVTGVTRVCPGDPIAAFRVDVQPLGSPVVVGRESRLGMTMTNTGDLDLFVDTVQIVATDPGWSSDGNKIISDDCSTVRLDVGASGDVTCTLVLNTAPRCDPVAVAKAYAVYDDPLSGLELNSSTRSDPFSIDVASVGSCAVRPDGPLPRTDAAFDAASSRDMGGPALAVVLGIFGFMVTGRRRSRT